MKKKPRPVHTIGHSDLDLEKFIDRLEQNGMELVADVRSMPHSRYAPQFNREELAGALGQRGIGYIHMGDELGGRPTEDRLYDEQSRASYRLMALEPKFQEGVRQLAQTAMERRLALLCTERDPLKCHRTLLVAPALEKAGVPIVHIGGRRQGRAPQGADGPVDGVVGPARAGRAGNDRQADGGPGGGKPGPEGGLPEAVDRGAMAKHGPGMSIGSHSAGTTSSPVWMRKKSEKRPGHGTEASSRSTRDPTPEHPSSKGRRPKAGVLRGDTLRISKPPTGRDYMPIFRFYRKHGMKRVPIGITVLLVVIAAGAAAYFLVPGIRLSEPENTARYFP